MTPAHIIAGLLFVLGGESVLLAIATAKVGGYARRCDESHKMTISTLEKSDAFLSERKQQYHAGLARKDKRIQHLEEELVKVKTELENNKNRPFVIHMADEQIMKLGMLVRGALQDLHESRFGKPN